MALEDEQIVETEETSIKDNMVAEAFRPSAEEALDEALQGEEADDAVQDEAEEEEAEEGYLEEGDDDESSEGESPSGEGEEGSESDEGADAPELDLSQTVTLKINGEEVSKTIEETIAMAQKATASEEKFRQASAKEKNALTVIDALEKDPLGTYYVLLADKYGDEQAYKMALDHARAIVGRELEYESLPADEKERRKAQAALQRKEAEIERLRKKQEADSRKLQEETLIRDIIDGAKNAGLSAEEPVLRGIAVLYDSAAQSGQPISVQEAVQRYLQLEGSRQTSYLQTLSDDALAEMGLQRAKAKPTLPKTRKRRQQTSTNEARPKTGKSQVKQDGKPPRYFKNWKEAYLNS